MGAVDFRQFGKGTTAQAAFRNAVADAQHEHGHGGYTGTLAEKYSIVEIPVSTPMDRKTALAKAQELLDADDPRIVDKNGPAGCIKVEGGLYLFFGWARS